MPPTLARIIHHSPLTQSAFAAFGTVIENPTPLTSPLVIPSPVLLERAPPPASTSPPTSASLSSSAPTPSVVLANQNTALKHINVALLTNTYAQRAPSRVPGSPVMNMFSCYPRVLRPAGREGEEDGAGGGGDDSRVFPIRILERHPFTSQTFIPLGLAASDGRANYLVIVAPTVPSSSSSAAGLELPRDYSGGMPDVEGLRAFLAHGGQAVTYNEGTWHAPMAVVGGRRVDFVVVQACNGVSREECEEVELRYGNGEGIGVWLGRGEEEGSFCDNNESAVVGCVCACVDA